MNNSNFKDYYKILQVDRNAAQEVITVAYKSLAKKYHPDLNLNNLNEANEKMKDINEAYRILNSLESRKKYNLTYDSYIKNDINNSSINDSDVNNGSVNNSSVDRTYNSYMTRKDRKEYAKKENLKRNVFLKFKKKNIAIASIIAIFFTYMIAEKVLISNHYDSIGKIEKGVSTNVKQTNRMKDGFDNNHSSNPDNHPGKPVDKANSYHDMQTNDASN